MSNRITATRLAKLLGVRPYIISYWSKGRLINGEHDNVDKRKIYYDLREVLGAVRKYNLPVAPEVLAAISDTVESV